MNWYCAADWMAPPPTPTCGAHGTTDKGAEDHTRATGHPTIGTTRDDWEGGV